MTVQPATEAAETAAGLLAHLEKTGSVPRESLEQLCSLAVSDDPAAARAGTDAIFRVIVEPLGDRFEAAACDRYVRFFSGVIDFCRRHSSLRSFDAMLRDFGLNTEQDVLARAGRVRARRKHQGAALSQVKTVLVPSRVTLGADIAVTSVILGRMRALFPEARITLLGSAKAGALFASDPRVDLLETRYARSGTLRERLEAWVALCGTVAEQIEGLRPEEYLIIDPDSRLTQLGLLPPIADDSRYHFFESRSFSAEGVTALGRLTNRWLNDVFDLPEGNAGPFVALPVEDMQRGRELRAKIEGKIAAVNPGVGENAEKRVDDPFEIEMLRALLEAGYTVILDRGAGDEELQRTTRLVSELESAGKTAGEITPSGGAAADADLLLWDGSLSGFGGLIASADLYAGYDSAGGHLAAALGTPVIDVFTDAAPARMRERWAPSGKGPVHVFTARGSAPQEALRLFRAALREQPR